MQLEPWQYQDHFLMVTVKLNRDSAYTFLADHMQQAEVVQHMMTAFTQRPNGFEVALLDEDSYDLLEPGYRKQGKHYILEG